jgi:hypothetical protein
MQPFCKYPGQSGKPITRSAGRSGTSSVDRAPCPTATRNPGFFYCARGSAARRAAFPKGPSPRFDIPPALAYIRRTRRESAPSAVVFRTPSSQRRRRGTPANSQAKGPTASKNPLVIRSSRPQLTERPFFALWRAAVAPVHSTARAGCPPKGRAPAHQHSLTAAQSLRYRGQRGHAVIARWPEMGSGREGFAAWPFLFSDAPRPR